MYYIQNNNNQDYQSIKPNLHTHRVACVLHRPCMICDMQMQHMFQVWKNIAYVVDEANVENAAQTHSLTNYA